MDYVECSCCGVSIPDTPEENLDHAKRLQDAGYGNCKACFGEPARPQTAPTAKGQLPTESECKRRLGWAGVTFYESRFATLRKALKGAQLAHFEALPYAKKIIVVGKLVEKGTII